MEVLIDTNVILNYSTQRDDDFLDASNEVMKLCAMKKINGYMAFHSISTLWYLLRKVKSDSEVRIILENLCDFVTISSIEHSHVVEAIRNKDFSDFEDCLQDECAFESRAEYIITCNIKDFSNAKVQAVNPEQFLEIYGKHQKEQNYL